MNRNLEKVLSLKGNTLPSHRTSQTKSDVQVKFKLDQ